MKTALNEQLDEVVQLRGAEPAAVLSEALTAGMRQVYLDAVLAAYFQGRLSREDAVARLGVPSVLRADEELRIAQNDVEWGLRA